MVKTCGQAAEHRTVECINTIQKAGLVMVLDTGAWEYKQGLLLQTNPGKRFAKYPNKRKEDTMNTINKDERFTVTAPKDKHIDMVVGRLKSQGIDPYDKWETVEKCLSETVCPEFCIAVARWIKKQA